MRHALRPVRLSIGATYEMDSKNLTIGVLSITAVILLVGVVIIGTRPAPAVASGMTADGGDYVLTVGQLHTNSELLYIIDAGANKLAVYDFQGNTKQIQALQLIDLAEMRQAAGDGQDSSPQQPTTPSQRPSRRGQRRP